MNDKLILTDADGVLLDWEYAFNVWMEQHGFQKQDGYQFIYDIGDRFGIPKDQSKKLVKIFNESAAIGFLPALRDATYYVKRLHEEHGYQFRVITSLSLDPNAGKLREMNLRKIFGDAIETVICLDTGADKDEELVKYKDSNLWWIEDKPANALAGVNVGLNSILVEHGHNMHHDNDSIKIAKNWREIYEIILA